MKKKDPSRKTKGKKARKASASIPKPDAFPIVGIGASAGGFEAFTELLKNLPLDSGMALVFIQHLDPDHKSALSEILSHATKIPVIEVTDGMEVMPDRLYVIPANTTMVLEDGELRLGARRLVRGRHLPIDLFLQSLAEERGNQAIGVILSGSASDGTEGCRAIKAEGGITFAQDENSAKFPSMPRSAAIAGCIDFVLPPQEIARELIRIRRHPYIAQPKPKTEEPSALPLGRELSELLALVREASGVDFGLYKQTTLQRRIRRRMILLRMNSIKAYLRYARQNRSELDELYRDFLIHVTGFFRDKGAYEALAERIFPALFHHRNLEANPIRIWIPGCSTGEEVYSVAITLLEFLWEKAKTSAPGAVTSKAVQIFASDISESALDRARLGLYTDAAVAQVAPERLARFFVHLEDGYQINKSIRDMCIFARQNVTQDPPYSNIDLITCRNLLIYLGTELQKRVIPTLHYALTPNGYLMLGSSESLGPFSDHFVLIDKKHKIYQKKRSAGSLITYFTSGHYPVRRLEPSRAEQTQAADTLTMEKEVERVLVNRFVPASIVVNDQMEIVQFRGRTGAYLEPAPGYPTFSLSKMAREGLLVDLRTALNKARINNTAVRVDRVHVKSNGHTKEVDLEVIPVQGQRSGERFYVVVFQEPRRSLTERTGHATRGKQTGGRSQIARENNRFKQEAAQLREQLKLLIEENETTAEEFKSANEEVLSANEELQSTNEELETAKEELQSSNEELTTLNEELQNRNTALNQVNSDLLNLMDNVNIPIVMVGKDLRIRRFTLAAQNLLNLSPSDVGRRLREVRPNLDVEDLETALHATVDRGIVQEQEVREKDGAWHLMRVRPYKTVDNKMDGAVLSFQDIDDLKRAVKENRDFADALIQNTREALLVLDSHLRVSAADLAFYKLFHLAPEEVQGCLISDLAKGLWIPPELPAHLQQVVRHKIHIEKFELSHAFPQLGGRTMRFNARWVESKPGEHVIMLAIEDVTDYKKDKIDLLTHSALLELSSDAVLVRDLEGTIQLWNRSAERTYGWTKAEAMGKHVYELLKTKFPAPLSQITEQLSRHGHWEGELIHTRKDGEQRYVESRWSLHLDGDTQTILELNTDITDRKRYEEQLQKLSGQLMQVQDEERRRIARDLHDSTGQKLVALKMTLAQNEKPTASSREEQAKLVDEILSDIRTLSQVLHPPLLEEAGLLSATRWLVDGFSQRAGIKVSLNAPARIERLPANVEIALFRIIQEALNNIHRHSGAAAAQVEVKTVDGSLFLKISDNGHGMKSPPAQRDTRLGVGLLGMRERLSQLGGHLAIHSGEKGTSIEAQVPLSKVPGA